MVPRAPSRAQRPGAPHRFVELINRHLKAGRFPRGGELYFQLVWKKSQKPLRH